MNIEILPASLLNGKYLHCRPVEDGPTIRATIVQSEKNSTPMFSVAIVCPARGPNSRCVLRKKAGRKKDFCHYYKGDSRGKYQIIGPGMDKKSKEPWK